MSKEEESTRKAQEKAEKDLKAKHTLYEQFGSYDHERSKQEVKKVPSLEEYKKEGDESITPAMLRQQQEYIKNYRAAKKQYNPVEDLPKLNPEPDYIIKTRPPMWDDWRLNIFRGIKENRCKLEANKIARRKCWQTGGTYQQCMEQTSMWRPGKCRKEFDAFLQCCYHEQQVELDKIRRDTKTHNEWWWLNLYDENGEIGKQAEWEPETQLTKIWTTFIYNMVFKPDQDSGLTKAMREARLEELRKKQGLDINSVKSDFEEDFHLDMQQANKFGKVDKQIYNV